MASKHDGKKARANMWVTHQNLARAKGGRPGFQFTPKQPRPPTTPAPVASDATGDTSETAPAPRRAPTT